MVQTLTPVQEAQLDVACYPWCPDIWNVASILAAKHGDDTPDTIRSDANNAVVPAASLVPQHCTAEMLALPLLAHGYGLQLKRKALFRIPARIMIHASFSEMVTLSLRPRSIFSGFPVYAAVLNSMAWMTIFSVLDFGCLTA